MIVKIAVPQRFQFKLAAGFGDVMFHKPGDTHYIGGTEVLPAPLEPEAEQELLSMFGKENEGKAKSILIEHNLRL